MAGIIRVGTASWADPDFVKSWYPKGLPAQERLPWYAEHFSFVEVNSSFYAVPAPTTVETWVEQTPEEFVFDLKLFKGLSRHAMKAEDLAPALRPLGSSPKDKVLLGPDLEGSLLDSTEEAIRPLITAGKLGALLLQLSPEFSPKKHDLSELLPVINRLRPYGLAVELRNRNWMVGEEASEVVEFFEREGVSLVMVDAPKSENFTIMPSFEVVTNSKLAYVRLHGRDEKAYTTGKSVSERFKYDYSDSEIQETVDKAKRLAEEAEEVHIVYNNNHWNYAPNAAEEFQRRLSK